ncbi:MAG TPA: FAD:protein FMN transferase [Planctomycetaceae bacterium]|jgi:thiamine biosynthesis lipoprotein|nr:FAD:protein FMN transferase [Planctomycetaceae bacterium]
MSSPRPPKAASRRDFLSGRALRGQVEQTGEAIADALLEIEPERIAPDAGPTVRLQTRAMACEFAVVMNPGPPRQVMLASDALDMIHALEAQMTVYRPDSELSHVNQHAAIGPVVVERSLFDLLRQARDISAETGGAFDPTSGPLIALWRRCRADGRIPTDDEIRDCLTIVGMQHVHFLEEQRAIQFDRPGVELNLGAIGKGHAVDRAGAFLVAEGLESWLFHGGYSSVLVRGPHAGRDGWPVGLRNPLIPSERLGTILLSNQALSTSGSNVQYFRHAGQRYGHILDPRTGWPPSHLLSVTVVASSAAVADALSTAFFVAGVENSLRYCDNHPQIGAIFVRSPERGRTLNLVVHGISNESLFFETEVQVEARTRA